MKTKTILIAAVMFFALSVAAYAQATFAIGSIPVTTVVRSGLTEKTGDITFTTIANSPSVITGTIQIYYGVPITFVGAVYDSAGIAIAPSVIAVAKDAAGTSLVLTIPAPIATLPYTFRVSGARVAVAGTGLTSLSVNLSATGNAIQAGQTSGIPVINSISPGIDTVTATNAQTYYAVQGGSGIVTLKVKEKFVNAFGVTNLTDTTQTISTMVAIVVPRPLAGVSLSFPQAATSTVGAFTLSDAAGAALAAAQVISSASADPTYVYYRVTTDTSLTAIDTMSVDVTVTATAPLTTTGSVAVKASFAAFGTVTGTVIPRYVEDDFGNAILVTINPSTTYMLMPYATSLPNNDYDTGIAVANTTKRPTAFTMVAQAGAITFTFFPQADATGTLPASFSYTPTDNTVGNGLNADGKLAAGSTYAVLLSQLLAKTTFTGNFSGYIVVTTNFTNAHGEYFVFTTTDVGVPNPNPFTHGALMLVLDTANSSFPEKLDN